MGVNIARCGSWWGDLVETVFVTRYSTSSASLVESLEIACGDLSNDYLHLITLIWFILAVMAVNGFSCPHGNLQQGHAQVPD